MECKYHKIRTDKGVKFGYCIYNKDRVNLFNCKCDNFECKKYKLLTINKTTLKSPKNSVRKSNKITKLEKNRFSILTTDLTKCIECGKTKNELHEVFEGSYRIRSMEYGCVIPLCVECHRLIHHNQDFKLKYKRLMKSKFEATYPDIEFNTLFYYKEKD